MKLYSDPEWLKEQYLIKKLYLKDIAKLANCNDWTITKYLRKYGISNGKEYKQGQCIYPELNDKEWLYQKYYEEKLSTLTIQKLIGAKQCNSVRQALIRFGLVPRNYREGQILDRQDGIIDNEDFIEGSLLGDMSLSIYNRQSSICQPRISKKNKYKDHIDWFGKHISTNPKIVLETKMQEFPNPKYNKICSYYQLRTLSSDKLRKYYDRWYPASNNYVKVVPSDLTLTPTKILNWFLDDGYSHYRNRTNEFKKNNWSQRIEQVTIGFCSQSFTREENEYLVEELRRLGISAAVGTAQQGTKCDINIRQSNSNKFFDLIGPCPVPSLQYKWKIIP